MLNNFTGTNLPTLLKDNRELCSNLLTKWHKTCSSPHSLEIGLFSFNNIKDTLKHVDNKHC